MTDADYTDYLALLTNMCICIYICLYTFGCTCIIMVIVTGNECRKPSSNLDLAVCILHCANPL